ncbi:MAG: DUF6391 domain-containing protein, partial [Chloroflexota bacterium]
MAHATPHEPRPAEVRLPFGKRLRQNHALEHATMAILQQRDPRARIIARSTSRGFKLYGTAHAD